MTISDDAHKLAEAWEAGWSASRRFENACEEGEQRAAATNPYKVERKTTILRINDPNAKWDEL